MQVNKKRSKRIMMRRRGIFITFLVFVLGIGTLKLSDFRADAKEREIMQEQKRLDEEARIKKEKRDELDSKVNAILDSEHGKIIQAIESIVNSNNNYGIYYEDLVSGNVYEYNATKDFVGASTVKVPLVIGAADLIASGKLSPEQTVKYISSDYEGGTGILQGSSELNKPIKVSRLIEVTITHSDNIATQMLKRVSTDITKVVNSLTGIPRKTGGNYINAKQLGILMKRLYLNKGNNPQYDVILEHMRNTVFHDRLDKYVPQELVAHKIGNNGGYTHDTGIIYTNRPYTLTVLTQSVGSETMAKMNKSIYDIKLATDKEIEDLKAQYKTEFGIE
ncbi:MAG: serine hydrolase [Clostridium sp.]